MEKKKFYYPKNLEAPYILIAWTPLNLAIASILIMLGIWLWVNAGNAALLFAAGVFMILQIQNEETSFLEQFLKLANYLIFSQQFFRWEKVD